MKRREFLSGFATLALPSVVNAQASHLRRIGFLGGGSASGFATQITGLQSGLKELGYVEGRTIAIEFRYRAQVKPEEIA